MLLTMRDSSRCGGSLAIFPALLRASLFVPAMVLWTSPTFAQTCVRGSSNYRFTSFDVPNATSTRAHGINAPGQIVGRYIDSSGNHHGFLRSADGTIITTIDPNITGFPNISKIAVRSINARGEMVGRFLDSSGISHGFFRSRGGTYSTIDVPASFGASGTDARGINDVGQVSGIYIVPQTVNGVPNIQVPHGFVRSADGTSFTEIDYPGALATVVGGLNDAGEIVGGYADTPASGIFFVPHGFTLRGGVFTTFDSACGTTGTFGHSINEPFTVNGSDSTKANFFNLQTEDGAPDGLSGFVMSPDGTTFTSIDFPATGERGTQVRGMNARGTVVGDYVDSSDVDHAFLATP